MGTVSSGCQAHSRAVATGQDGLEQRMDKLDAWQDKGLEPQDSASVMPTMGGCWALTGVCTGMQGDYTQLQLSNEIIPAALMLKGLIEMTRLF